MSKKLQVTVDAKATEKFMQLAAEKTEAEINEDCLPSGSSLLVLMAAPFGAVVYCNDVELGSAKVVLVDS